MGDPADLDKRYHRCRSTLAPRGQEHVLRFWNELNPLQRAGLLCQIETIPWDLLDPLIPTHVLRRPPHVTPTNLQPATTHRRAPGPGQAALYREAADRGHELIRTGKVAAFTVAGGQGTRLGIDGPKGTVPVTPAGDRTLFEIFAKTVRAVRDRHGVTIPWYIMTSAANHDQTVTFLERHDYFGLPARDVILFRQAMLPAFDQKGRVLLASTDSLALAPDGHGGSLKALVASGALDDMRARGVDVISYFQVDNPLVKPFDALFVGLHAVTGSEMSVKVVAKADDLERVGNVCACEGRLMVIEYCDFPDANAHAVNEDGTRRFNAGNLAIHLLSVAFVERVAGCGTDFPVGRTTGPTFKLPYRRADKAVSFVDETGCAVKPSIPNAIKLETFVFDALPLASNALAYEVDRAEEFSPVKNATGVDSLASSKRDQNLRACRWLASAGVAVPRRVRGEPDVTVAISPSFALNAEELKDRADQLPLLAPGDAVYLE